jgi:SOS-response transcriptional repressor LexA
MAQRADQAYRWNGCLYVPCHTVRLAAGPFFSVAQDWVEQHLELPHGFLLDRHLGIRVYRAGLAAARVHGDSMMDRDILHGDIAIFQRYDFSYLQNGAVVVIEKRGEEEGFGAWALKTLVIERPRLSRLNAYEDEIDWDDPVFVLRSYNPRVRPSELNPLGQYRVHGVLLRCVRRHDAKFVDSEMVRHLVTGEEASW